jgi:HSP20 family protein
MFASDTRFWNTISDMERLLDHASRSLSRRGAPGRAAPLNIWANQDELTITSEVPGVDPASITATVLGDTLTVSGKRTEHGDDFERSVSLPFRVDPDRTEARVANGILTVALRRPESEKPRKIQVTAA